MSTSGCGSPTRRTPLLKAGTGPGQSTHKVGRSAVEDVTPEVEALLRAAYDQNG